MAVWERRTQKPPCKPPSFSSSLLDAIYHSMDQTEQQDIEDFILRRRNNAAARFEQDFESLKRAILIEKWMESHRTSRRATHFSSNSAGSSSTDSSVFSSSETESSASRSTPKSYSVHKQKFHRTPFLQKSAEIMQIGTVSNRQGNFAKTKSRAEKPSSPRGKIANFLNSIFSPRSTKASQEEWRSVRKSRSMKETTTTTSRSLASRSCLSKNASSKSTRTVRFCLVGDEDRQKNIYDDELLSVSPSVGSQFIKKNIDRLKRQEFQDYYQSEGDVDGVSCGSSDLFELENIGGGGIEEELPVFGTTSLGMTQNIAGGLVV